jgi:hypothetical protein
MTTPNEGVGPSAPRSPEGTLDMPLIEDQDSTLWNESPPGPGDPSVWPALSAAVSEAGRRLLWEGLREAVNATPGDPERALMVVEAFRRTMQVRRDPDHD